jgi:hypothetical protein
VATRFGLSPSPTRPEPSTARSPPRRPYGLEMPTSKVRHGGIQELRGPCSVSFRRDAELLAAKVACTTTTASVGLRSNGFDGGRQARVRSPPSDMNRTVRLRDGHHTSSSSFSTLVATSGALLSVDRPPGSPTAITPWRPRLLHPRSRDGRRRPCLAASRPFASLTTRTNTTRPFRGTWREAAVVQALRRLRTRSRQSCPSESAPTRYRTSGGLRVGSRSTRTRMRPRFASIRSRLLGIDWGPADADLGYV